MQDDKASDKGAQVSWLFLPFKDLSQEPYPTISTFILFFRLTWQPTYLQEKLKNVVFYLDTFSPQ